MSHPPPTKPPQDIQGALHWAAEFLPAQGPLTAFVHHNTLHAFEDLPFEEAVVQAGQIYDCQPFLAEDWYRRHLNDGRITMADLEWALQQRRWPPCTLPAGLSLRRLQLGLLVHPLHVVPPERLDWHLEETSVLRRWRQDLPAEVRQILESQPGGPSALWQACQQALDRIGPGPLPPARYRRHRDALLAAGGPDIDDWVNPVLIRWAAAFLDQGLASAALPGRERGLLAAVRALYAHPGLYPDWLRPLPQELAGDLSLEHCLEQLGVSPEERAEFLRDTLLVLKGWGGMLGQAESRPERLPFEAVPARLEEFCALRLLLERLALRHGLRALGRDDLTPAQLRQAVTPPLAPDPCLSRAYELFQVCQILALGARQVNAWESAELEGLLAELGCFTSLVRRELLHLAYEHNHEVRTLDALSLHAPQGPGRDFQVVFCIDEREESARRHLEEIAPHCETFGTAGFFGLPMFFQALDEPHPVALCPVSLRPRHLVREAPAPELEQSTQRQTRVRRSLGRVSLGLESGSHSLAFGGLMSAGLGLLTALPGILRVLFPRLAGLFSQHLHHQLRPRKTQLILQRQAEPKEGELALGFTPEEMATIVGNLLEDTGLAGRLTPLVLMIGHGSSSLNNPHEAAHDCGACGGGRGGPNARVFAAMANLPVVRQLLAERGLHIPPETRFVGAYHNTCDDALELFDLAELTPELQQAVTALQEARARDAQERCRRFLSAAPGLSPGSALRHVEARASDLAQPRPEYGHATNAVAVIGRRSRTRGLFMDRRAFLISYDPEQDDANQRLLDRVLAAVVPVIAGINLEYYFSFVDNSGYGCGTKLPHNITALLGVMDGSLSDLRTGLPWQMVEIHEPVRLLVVVEALPAALDALMLRQESLRRLVHNRWIRLAALDPGSQQIWRFERGSWRGHQPAHPLPRVEHSHHWYEKQREPLDYAEVSG